MIRTYILLILIAFNYSISFADEPEKPDSVIIPPYKLTDHQAFQGGEHLTFTLNYGFVTGGKAHLSAKDTVLNDKKVLHVVARGATVGLPDVLYKIRDRYESFIDDETDLPIKAVRSIREGRYRYYNEVSYNRDSSQVISQKSGVHPVQRGILDIISAFCFARSHKFNEELVKNEVIEFMTYFSDENFPLRIRFKGTEIVKTKFGKVECYLFSPVTEVGRAFKTEDDMQVWISRDKNRIPVKIRFNLAVGAFTCELEEFKGLKYPFESIQF